MRNRYRVEAIVDEKTLHRALLTFADIKALNVSVMPVTTPKANGAHPPATAPQGKVTGSALVRVFAADRKKPFTADDICEVAPDGMSKQLIHQTLFNLMKGGELKRISQGKYRRTAKLKPAAAANGAGGEA